MIVDPSSNEVGTALAAVRGITDAVAIDQAAGNFVAEGLGGDLDEAREVVSDAAASIEPVRAEEVGVGGRRDTVSAFAYPAPANMVLFVFINTLAISTALASDRKAGIIRRIASTPHHTGTVLLGMGAARFAFSLVQSLIVVVLGLVVFDVDWGNPSVAVALIVVWAWLSTAVGVLVGSLVADSEQAQAIGIPIGVAMGMLGGCMWPLDIVPEALRVIGHVTPHAWVMDAWDDQVFGDASFTNAGVELLVLVGFAVVLSALAARALRAAVVR
jgi:ABC-2 type transport system permease protein